jgi:hypothetical protein
MENNIISRPVWNNAIRGKRAEVWHWRSVSAWDLAALVCGDNVTETEYNAAFKLLDRVQRYALADAAEWERENSSESYCNSAYHKQRERQLNARRARLQTELARYGVKMENYGLYPTIIKTHTRENCYFLHYFD